MRFYFPKEYKALIKLGVPITIGQVGLTLQNLADNVMVGRHSTAELAAAGFVNNMFMLVLLLTIGFSLGAVSQIGALYAQGNKKRIVEVLKSSIACDMLQGLLMCLVLVALYFFLPMMGQPDELLPLMRPYLVIQICSLPFMFVAGAFKQFTDSINDTAVAMTIMLIGNAWNIVGNWLLIFGNCGFPEMGIEGAAWATFSSRVVIMVLTIAVFFLRPKYKTYVAHWKTAKMCKADMSKLNRLGWPIAIQMGMESASFTLVAIFLGWMGTNVLAAHQVMLNMANLIFMFYIGISSAVTIRVSNYNGLQNMRGVRHAAVAGWQMILCLGIVLSIVAFSFRHDISFLFTDDAEVAAIVAGMAYPLVLYQLGDGMQVTFANALRGLGDVKMLMRYSFLAYMVISLPLSYLMGVVLDWQAFGIWMGFPFGLTTAGILYLRRFLKVSYDGKLRH
ncbi:MAG: MATE family efflux transporter [Bacteroidaceae bacterium]|nr:MATE family efflux transporter [Bacteroidaceae bacterium]